MLKKTVSITFIVLSFILIGSVTLFNEQSLYAQEENEDKCNFFLSKYSQTYKECFGGNIIEEFVPKKFAEFGIVTLEEEWLRLDNLIIQSNNNPESQIFIVIYGGKINKKGELKERQKRLFYYLTETRNFVTDRVTVVNGGFRENFEFEFWESPSDKIFPPLSPTVDVEKVKFKGKMKPLPLDLYPDN